MNNSPLIATIAVLSVALVVCLVVGWVEVFGNGLDSLFDGRGSPSYQDTTIIYVPLLK